MNYTLINRNFLFVLYIFIISVPAAYSQSKDSVTVDNNAEISDRSKSSFNIRPDNYGIQYAGSIGLISIGTGWEYGKNNRWQTDFLIGYVPKYDTDIRKITLTLRQTFTPWSIPLNDRISYSPLRAGVFISTTLGRKFWYNAPDKYPKDYYTFSTKLRGNIFVGQSFNIKVSDKKKALNSVSFYYDIHTSDLMLITRVQNSSLSHFDYLGIALGIKIHI